MNRFFMGCLSLAALALVITQAIAGDNTPSANANSDGDGVMVIETYSSTVMTNQDNQDEDMQPLPEDPGVEVAPVDSSVAQPMMIEEEGVIIHQTAD